MGLGLIGVLSLIPVIIEQLHAAELIDEGSFMLGLLAALLNSLVLTAAASAVGLLLAHRVGLRSLTVDRFRRKTPVLPDLVPHLPLACISGIVFLVIVVLLDQFVFRTAEAAVLAAEAAADMTDLLTNLLVGIVYGGIVEELLLRWGVMSFLVWIGWRLLQKGKGRPKPALLWSAVVLAALLFGAGHLPALASVAELTPLLVVRTILLNSFGGVLFGWLFWKRNLETAMVSHGSFHVGLFIINLILLQLGH